MADGLMGLPDSSPKREDIQCLTRSWLSSSCSVSSALWPHTNTVTRKGDGCCPIRKERPRARADTQKNFKKLPPSVNK